MRSTLTKPIVSATASQPSCVTLVGQEWRQTELSHVACADHLPLDNPSVLSTPSQKRRRNSRMLPDTAAQFTGAINVSVFFCDPHAPWQRGSNENTNGLLRQYFPESTDLSRHTQTDLNAVARELKRAMASPPSTFSCKRRLQIAHQMIDGNLQGLRPRSAQF